jgi:lysophospholipase L1-like esterase
MSIRRRLLFAAATLLILLGVAELGSRIVWNGIEARAFATRQGAGEALLANNRINFMSQTDGVYGYALRPGLYTLKTRPESRMPTRYFAVTPEGFAQRAQVPVERASNVLRIAAMGESTTSGHEADTGNYPIHLRAVVAEHASDGRAVEMLNAGVPGWVSDQLALRAERQVARYRPQIVILYAGWNDFQSYDPYRAAPARSWFTDNYGNPYRIESDFPLKLPVLAVAAAQRVRNRWESAPVLTSTPTGSYSATVQENYRFLTASLDRIVATFRSAEPGVTIAISTLVARWPHGSDFESDLGRTWWMKYWNLGPEKASEAMRRFNQFLRDYAAGHGLALIDAERAFDDLDRPSMMRDFAHMTDEGYELLANVMYEDLRRGGHLRGEPNPRLQELLDKYRKSPTSSVRNASD